MSFIGDQVNLTSYDPAIASQDVLFSGNAVAVNGVTFSPSNLTVSGAGNIIVPTTSFGPSTLNITYPAADNGMHFLSGGFNGLVYTTDPTDQAIGDVNIASTNIHGLTDQDITAAAHSVSINVENLSVPINGFIDLVASFGPPFYEVNNQGQQISWTNPQNLTISGAGLPAQFRPLLIDAEQYWEAFANIHFNDVTNNASASRNADIQVGVEKFHPNSTAIFGDTPIRFIGNDINPPIMVAIEDPTETPVTQLPDGDFAYQGNQGTVFQYLVHELGHALGLAHNTTDPTSIMAPNATPNNTLIDLTDAAAISGLYGPPVGAPPLPSIVAPSESGF